MSIHAHSKHHHPARDVPAPTTEKGFVAFPTGGQDEPAPPSSEYWDGRSTQPQHRTVRRKKSSFDLREQLEAIKTIADYEIFSNHDVVSMSRHEVDDILSRA